MQAVKKVFMGADVNATLRATADEAFRLSRSPCHSGRRMRRFLGVLARGVNVIEVTIPQVVDLGDTAFTRAAVVVMGLQLAADMRLANFRSAFEGEKTTRREVLRARSMQVKHASDGVRVTLCYEIALSLSEMSVAELRDTCRLVEQLFGLAAAMLKDFDQVILSDFGELAIPFVVTHPVLSVAQEISPDLSSSSYLEIIELPSAMELDVA
jgi:hypothetical protein